MVVPDSLKVKTRVRILYGALFTKRFGLTKDKIEIDENNKDDIENIIKNEYADYENENGLN